MNHIITTSHSISKKLPEENPSLDFKKLRKEGIELLQALSGNVWTDYNLHDPGVTTLEVLCYALTDLGYRTELLKEAFESEEAAAQELINRYFFRYDELMPPLPLSRQDFEQFIEENHDSVLAAWFEDYPVLHPAGTIRGGHEIAVLLEPDERYGNLNTDVIRISLERGDAILEVNIFDEENRRMEWKQIQKVLSCRWDRRDQDRFFVFEDFNCQAALIMEVVYRQRRQSKRIRAKARVTLNPLKKSRKKIGAYQKAIIQTLESPEFLDAIARTLSKEHHKERVLNDIQQSLLPFRNLCEDFVSLRVVNEQEVKIDAKIVLDDRAPGANMMINRIYDRLDAFLMKLLRRARHPEHRTQPQKHILYASNLIEEMVKTEGVEAAGILHLNLFIDGIPTIPVKDEKAFECIHLQRFSYYVPKISRGKSSITFVRSGVAETADPASVSREFTPQLYLSGVEPSAGKPEFIPEKKRPAALDKRFLEALRHYVSIRNDFPQAYRLGEGDVSDQTPEPLRIRIKQFKAYLAFFERVLIDYLDRLSRFNDLLSVKQEPGAREYGHELERLKEELSDLDLDLSHSVSSEERDQPWIRQNQILDHLLARFATTYRSILPEGSSPETLEHTVQAKSLLLRDMPVVTRERGLGLLLNLPEKKIWNSDLVSGFQKRVYRTLGVNNNDFRHLRLARVRSTDPAGFYLVEHILLVRREEDHVYIKRFNRDAEVLYDYLRDLSGGTHQYEPYSFQLTIVLPAWYPSWKNRKNRVEAVIKEELPAHILPWFLWLNKTKMREFEIIYEDWLRSLLRLQTMRPL